MKIMIVLSADTGKIAIMCLSFTNEAVISSPVVVPPMYNVQVPDLPTMEEGLTS